MAGKQWLCCITDRERHMKMAKAELFKVNYLKKCKYRRWFFPPLIHMTKAWRGVKEQTERKQNYSWKLGAEAKSLEEQRLDCQLTGWKKMWQQVKCKQSATRELKKLKQNAKKLEGKPFSSTDHEEFKDKCMSPERNPVTGGVHIFLWFKTPTPSSCFNT